MEGLAEIILAKHRNGAVTDVKLRFIKDQAKFANWDQSGVHSAEQYEEVASAPYSSSASSTPSSLLSATGGAEFDPGFSAPAPTDEAPF